MAKCKSCGAEILWLTHVNTGKNAPVDAEPSENGNLSINALGGTYGLIGLPLRSQHAGKLHTNHFQTCPQSADWRAKAKA